MVDDARRRGDDLRDGVEAVAGDRDRCGSAGVRFRSELHPGADGGVAFDLELPRAQVRRPALVIDAPQEVDGDELMTISETGENVPTFGSPVTILPPRIARFSARFSF